MPKLKVSDFRFVQAEREFTLHDGQPKSDGRREVNIHPWHRADGPEVYIQIGEAGYIDQNIIVDRKKFVQGLLEVFPELTRAE